MSAFIPTKSTLDPAKAVYDHTVLAGDHWVHEVKQGQTLRIVDLEGNQAADTLFYNAHDPARSLQRVRHDSASGRAVFDDGHEAHLHARATRC